MELETEPTLFWATYFVQKTYVAAALPFLPEGATWKCKALANHWAHADPACQWAQEWDAEAEALKDTKTAAVSSPVPPTSLR